MKTLVCKEYGPPEKLCIEEHDDPLPRDGEVLVNIKAAGINFPDVLMIGGNYQVKIPPPFVPGGEVAGIIEAVGNGVTRYQAGDRVIAIPPGGGFAEKCVLTEKLCFPLPGSLSFEQGAGFTITYATSYHAFRQCTELKAGETVLVLGAAGGVGITAVEIAKALGARVIAAASSEDKLQFAREAGADETINYSEAPLKESVKELTGGKGVDVVYDPVGGDYAEPALRSMGWNGCYLVSGFASGPIPKIPLNLTLLKGCSIVGVFWGRFTGEEPKVHLQNIAELWELFSSGKLNPVVTDVFPLAQYEDAFNCMIERRARGKVILTL